jgi:hypothetical protein
MRGRARARPIYPSKAKGTSEAGARDAAPTKFIAEALSGSLVRKDAEIGPAGVGAPGFAGFAQQTPRCLRRSCCTSQEMFNG